MIRQPCVQLPDHRITSSSLHETSCTNVTVSSGQEECEMLSPWSSRKDKTRGGYQIGISYMSRRYYTIILANPLLRSKARPPRTTTSPTHQEIIRHRLLRRHAPKILRRRLKNPIPPAGAFPPAHARRNPADLTIRPLHHPAGTRILAQLQDGGDIAAAIAIVGRAPHGHDTAIEHLLEALHDQLVGARD